jgi:hypothetical protein
MLPYLTMKEGSLFCFVIMIFPKTQWLGYAMEFIIKKFSMNSGATIWFIMFRVIVWNLLLNHFFIEFFEKPIFQTILEFWDVLHIVGKPSPSLIQ